MLHNIRAKRSARTTATKTVKAQHHKGCSHAFVRRNECNVVSKCNLNLYPDCIPLSTAEFSMSLPYSRLSYVW